MQRRSFLPTVLAIIVGFALIPVPFAAAQDVAPVDSSVSVTGYGEALAPAETGTVRIAISGNTYGSPPVPQPGATPGARERESVAGVVAALVSGGIAEGDIAVFVGPFTTSVGSFYGPARAVLQFPLDAPTTDRITELVNAAAVAAADESLLVGQVNALFDTADCDALVSQAREAAIADAEAQALVQADLLGLTLGDVTSSTDLPAEPDQTGDYYGAYAASSTCEGGEVSNDGFFSIPLYDPSREPEVTAHARIALTFTVEDSGATPS